MHTPVIDLQQAAKDHLWLHFARMGAYRDGDVPIIAHGDGCYLEDTDGNRYLDGLAGLFAVQIGYSHGEEVGQAAVEQMRELPFYTNWSYKDPETLATFSDDESESLLRGFLTARLFERGLICRADDRGEPVVQISPPLVAGPAEFEQIAGILGDVLTEAWARIG